MHYFRNLLKFVPTNNGSISFPPLEFYHSCSGASCYCHPCNNIILLLLQFSSVRDLQSEGGPVVIKLHPLQGQVKGHLGEVIEGTEHPLSQRRQEKDSRDVVPLPTNRHTHVHVIRKRRIIDSLLIGKKIIAYQLAFLV